MRIEENLVSNKKTHKKLYIALLSIFLIVLVLLLSFFIYYKTKIDVAEKHSNVYEYTIGSNIDLPEYKLKDICEFDKNINKDVVTVKLPKLLVYKDIIKIDEFAKEINEKYKVSINRIGFIGDINDSSKIIVNADITYKGIIDINTFLRMYLHYEFIENDGIKVYFDDLSIGDNIPSRFYEKVNPYVKNEVLYNIDLSDYKLFDEETIELTNISNIKINADNITFNADYLNTITDFIEDNLGGFAPIVNGLIEEIAPNIIDEIINGNPDLSISDLLQSLLNKK